MTYLSEEATIVLTNLAKRKSGGNIRWWYKILRTSDNLYCNICCQEFKSKQNIKHGLQHLKEHNLLPFI